MTATKQEKSHPQGTSVPVFYRDIPFWLAVACGPVSWLLLWFSDTPRAAIHVPVTALLIASLIYPVLEEFVFRGGLQPALLARPVFRKRVGPVSLANVLTSIAFAAAHLLRQPPLWAALVLLPSLVFGWSRERYDSIVPPTLLHMFYNAGFIWLFVEA
ncbi:MAG: JDVT-CTERM system glutamic-type intramembrane protease [Granulosicoccus sp.]